MVRLLAIVGCWGGVGSVPTISDVSPHVGLAANLSGMIQARDVSSADSSWRHSVNGTDAPLAADHRRLTGNLSPC